MPEDEDKFIKQRLESLQEQRDRQEKNDADGYLGKSEY